MSADMLSPERQTGQRRRTIGRIGRRCGAERSQTCARTCVDAGAHGERSAQVGDLLLQPVLVDEAGDLQRETRSHETRSGAVDGLVSTVTTGL